MSALALHNCYQKLGARFTEINGMEVIERFGEVMDEYRALSNTGGVLDLSFRGRLCLGGTERKRFLHGQVTNNVNDLAVGQGCYAALTTPKGKMQSDLNIYCLPDELLLDFEPGFSAAVLARLEKYIIADDVQVTDVGPHYGLLSVQGPLAAEILRSSGLAIDLPQKPLTFTTTAERGSGTLYCTNNARGRTGGFDLFVPEGSLRTAFEKLKTTAEAAGGRACGWQALEMARIEAGLPRFGVDMDETNLPPEAGIEQRAISYSKGCYIGQEVIARIRTYGQVAKMLRGLLLDKDSKNLPRKGDKLFDGDKEAGYVTSSLTSPAFNANIALGYVRREHHQAGTLLRVRSVGGETMAEVKELPWMPPDNRV